MDRPTAEVKKTEIYSTPYIVCSLLYYIIKTVTKDNKFSFSV